jgi:hypothetical protein
MVGYQTGGDTMKQYKMAYIDSGGLWIFKEGGENNPRISTINYNTVWPWGNSASNFKSTQSIIKSLKEYDLIVTTRMGRYDGTPKDGIQQWVIDFFDAMEKHKLWNRYIIWDWADDDTIWEFGAKRCLVYLKRMWPWGREIPKRLWPFGKNETPSNVYPFDFCSPNCHLDLLPVNLYPRDISVGCFFGVRRYGESVWRGLLVNTLLKAKWNPDTYLDCDYTLGRGPNKWSYFSPVNLPFFRGNQLNWWYIYLHKLRRCQTLFTSPGNCGVMVGGDMRTSQAFASGALVFTPKHTIPLPHPYEEGKHCFFFVQDSKESILGAVEKAKYYLLPEHKEEREKIAKQCFDHTSKYHRSANRVNYALDLVEGKGDKAGWIF